VRLERGSSPIELVLGVMLIMVPAALLALAVGPWMEHRLFVRSAAAEAARILVLSSASDPRLEALDLVGTMATNLGIDPAGVSVGFCDASPALLSSPPSGACSLGRGDQVKVTVEAEVPGIPTPFGEVGGAPVRATHMEAVDLYRSRP
jgi:hypothetical protein